MQSISLSRRLRGLTVMVLGPLLMACAPVSGQFWEQLTKPQVTINLTHPPGLGRNIKRVAIGPSSGDCSGEVLNRLTELLLANGVQVMDYQTLQSTLAQQHIAFSGFVDQQSALRMGKVLGPTDLILVNIARCELERHRDFTDTKDSDDKPVRTFNATLTTHIRGSLQTVELTTGRIFSAMPIEVDPMIANHSTEKPPEFPSESEARDGAVAQVAATASQLFVKWNEERKIYFFNDKECNLTAAYKLLKANDLVGTVRLSEENITACKTWPKAKEANQAHAYYNAGVAYLLVDQHEKALEYLRQSEQMKGGAIVKQAIAETENSARLAAEMKRVEENTQQFERAQTSESAPSQSSTAGSGASVEERLKKLDALYKQGLITKEEYDAKKAEILKDL